MGKRKKGNSRRALILKTGFERGGKKACRRMTRFKRGSAQFKEHGKPADGEQDPEKKKITHPDHWNAGE